MTRLEKIAEVLNRYPDNNAVLQVVGGCNYFLRKNEKHSAFENGNAPATKEQVTKAFQNNTSMFLGIEGLPVNPHPQGSYAHYPGSHITWWQL